MSNQYISVHFKTSKEKEEIITAILFDAGFEGVEVKEEEAVASIKKDLLDEVWLKELMQVQEVTYSSEIVEQQNWNEAWESSFEPVVVGDFAAIRASFHPPIVGVQHDIIITPKMSFGTGHHATTYLVIQQMQELNFNKQSVIDFGTGTAVLAILAEKMGAASVYAIDNDEWSINNSKENIEANHCSAIELELANEMQHRTKAGIILANINLNVIIENLVKIREALDDDGLLIFSGLLVTDEENISRELSGNGFDIVKITHRNGWIAILTKPVLFPED